MSCCGGNNKQREKVDKMKNQHLEQVAKANPDKFVLCDWTGGSSTRTVKSVTRSLQQYGIKNYGLLGKGKQAYIHVADIKRQPKLFKPVQQKPTRKVEGGEVSITRHAKELAVSRGIDYTLITPSDGKRISKGDVENYIKDN